MNEIISQEYKNTDEYISLVEDSQSILTEGIFRSRQELIETYKALGERIYTDPLYKKWGQNTQGKFMRDLAQDIGNSIPVLYFAIQFYEKLTTNKKFSTAVENLGKNASWTKIRALLPEPKKEKTPELPEGKYQVIYADPPWDIGSMVLDKWESPLEDKYPTMTNNELLELPISELSADDCVCFMWSTLSTLPQALELLNNWGFDYHITLTWDKGNGWSMSGFHRKTELVLVGYKGVLSNVIKQKGEYIPTVFSEKKRKHSEKPEIMYKFLEERTIGSKLELFARIKRKGWNYWGNQLDGNN